MLGANLAEELIPEDAECRTQIIGGDRIDDRPTIDLLLLQTSKRGGELIFQGCDLLIDIGSIRLTVNRLKQFTAKIFNGLVNICLLLKREGFRLSQFILQKREQLVN
ncbi:MAG: hypothetical protein BWY50_01420 [Spirochaetes bacterium ADurb.Bin315]|nr:MAG: hypothetical protein BWY50_01420 [Spirochaetes bacterium ADurb.Bin315]